MAWLFRMDVHFLPITVPALILQDEGTSQQQALFFFFWQRTRRKGKGMVAFSRHSA